MSWVMLIRREPHRTQKIPVELEIPFDGHAIPVLDESQTKFSPPTSPKTPIGDMWSLEAGPETKTDNGVKVAPFNRNS